MGTGVSVAVGAVVGVSEGNGVWVALAVGGTVGVVVGGIVGRSVGALVDVAGALANCSLLGAQAARKADKMTTSMLNKRVIMSALYSSTVCPLNQVIANSPMSNTRT